MIVQLVKTKDTASAKPFGFYLREKTTHKIVAEESFETESERLKAIQQFRTQCS